MENDTGSMGIGELKSALTERQFKFAEAIIEGAEPKIAAQKAGYSEKTAAVQASRLLKNGKISAYIKARTSANAEEDISQDWVKRKLAEVAERCMEPTPHMVWDKSSQSYVHDGTWDFDADGAIKALSAIGKLDMLSEQPREKETFQGVEAFLEQLEGGRGF
ncbi:MAG: terminase small subunit [Oscillospiraceae bacterium]|nr:terminase small subunit [Oscillospiraceae bacterium]